jgi:hypothetical protein
VWTSPRPLLAARLARRRPREQDGEQGRGEEEGHACERGSGGVGAGVYLGEAGLRHDQVDVREHGDADEAEDDRAEVGEERTEPRPLEPGAEAQRPLDQRDRERGAHDPGEDRGVERSAEPEPDDGDRHEQRQAQREREHVEGGDGAEPLVAL